MSKSLSTDELLALYPHYYKDVRHLEVVDIYRVLELFNVTDPTTQHAIKKLMVPGKRSGGKGVAKDMDEAMHTLTRGQLMRAEDAKKGTVNTTVTVNVINTGGVVSKDHAERIAEHYLTPQPPPMAPPVADEALVEALHEYLTGASDRLPTPPPAAPAPRDLNKCSMAGCNVRRELGSLFCLTHQVPKAPAPPPPPAAPTHDVRMGSPKPWNPADYQPAPPPPPPAPMPPSNAKPPAPVDVCTASPQLPVETPNLPAPELPVDGLALAVHNSVNAGEPGKLPRL